VGNDTYYSADNIAYQTAWVACVKETTAQTMDFLGLWNVSRRGARAFRGRTNCAQLTALYSLPSPCRLQEKPQPPDASYVLALKASLAAAGFADTRVIVMDGQWDAAEFALAQSNSSFAAAVYGAGLHYPCDKPHPETADVGWALWASEDYSRDPAWTDGGTYWGKALSQNYVLMNATATISWSLIWSAYTNLVCNGAGLMRAHTPWSGNYEVSAPIWLTAHTTQFADPGYRYLSVASSGSGLIAAASGKPAGTWVTLVPPAGAPAGLTVVIETLVNDACVPRSYEPVAATFTVVPGGALPAPGTVLHVWRSRRDALFTQEADIAIAADGTFTLALEPDEMVTASTRADAAHGAFAAPVPAAAPWPLPFNDSFAEYADGALPRFFSDQGGAWNVRAGELVQVAWGDPDANGWGSDVDPLTQFGDESWADYIVSATVRFSAGGPYAAGARGPNGPLSLQPCDATDAAQSFVADVPAHGYLRNAATKGCIDVNGCATLVDSYECVDDPAGNSCGGPAGSYPNLMWAFDAASGHLTSGLGSVLTAFPNGTLYSLPIGSAGGAQSFDFNASSGQIAVRGGGNARCVSAPPKRVYARVCGRVAAFSGFAGDLTAVCLDVAASGAWSLYAHTGAAAATLASGTLAAFDSTARTPLSLAFAGPLIAASAGGVQLAQVDGSAAGAPAAGNVLLGAGWHDSAWSAVRVDAA
jgi:hypothetical protein